ncbi:hypothetical protein SAMN04489712_101630 [Thermomonospora echinospora]|uniref:Magnesium transporter NIPA n=1 Tax=Thermomonospora echinospora TaxID=1992 RepID=A0A1H5TI62_9ACTN|nr:hypothetical protein [Thermomonospora echinospora]SEF62499.1 hypothetical protein SAMN04489712_101630 [Thermomonospora echinospora]
MNCVVAALAAVCLYYLGAAFFKVAAGRMEPLHGRRPVHLIRQVLSDRLWVTGLLVFTVGLELQIVAFAELSLGPAQPLFCSTLLFLLVICLGYFGERLVPREWAGLGLFAVATMCIALSVPTGDDPIEGLPPTPTVVPVAALSLAVPLLLFPLVGRHATGRHARPLAGIAYGLICGLLLGTGEVAVKGLSIANGTRAHGLSLLAEPYLYLTLVAAGLGLCQGTIALQRCRMAIPMVVCTIVAKTYLLVVGSWLYGVGWPSDPLSGHLRLIGVCLAIGALFVFPRHERPRSPVPAAPLATAGPVVSLGSPRR